VHTGSIPVGASAYRANSGLAEAKRVPNFERLDASPLSLQRFEQDAGATNQSTIRLEGHATER
jgi:hypothetical protein